LYTDAGCQIFRNTPASGTADNLGSFGISQGGERFKILPF
jgi:hypothetical protein